MEARNPRAGTSVAHRLAYVVSHPIQYQAPLLRLIAQEPDIDLHVYFLSNLSGGGYRDPGFGTWIEWDVPLTTGYAHTFLSTGKRLSWGSRLVSELRRGRYDAVWIHGYAHLGNHVALLAAKASGAKVFLRGESHLGLKTEGPLRGAILRRLFSWADGFLAIGSLNAAFYRHYGVRDEDVYLMPYAVDNRYFADATERAVPDRGSLRARLQLEDGRPVVLFASKMTPVKGADVLLEAYLRLPEESAPHLVYVGDGEQRASLEARARGRERIRFLGFKNQSELPQYYDLCDVFVLPSRWEPWGLVINEVMNAGKPVVTTDAVGAAPDLVHDRLNGRVVPAGDPVALSDALAEIVSDPAIAGRMGLESRRIISRWDLAADLTGLRRALEGNAPAPIESHP